MQRLTVVTVTLEDREDGGLRVYSDDLPGLNLSGPSHDEVAAQIVPAIRALFERKGISGITIRPAKPISEVLRDSSPRSVHVNITHEQFVVELPEAA